jgi:hypothetical protein
MRRAWLLAAVLGIIWTAAYFLEPYAEHAPVVCTFRIVTGKPCPTCGMTRATCALAHGEWAKAMAYHPLVVPFWLTLAALLWTYLVMPLSVQTQRWRVVSTWAFIGVVGAGFVLRIVEWVSR